MRSVPFSSNFPNTDRQTVRADFSLCPHLNPTCTEHNLDKFRAIGSLSGGRGRGRPAMTAGGFNHHLTGGEAAHLIDYRQRLCIQGCCCCCCSLQHAALIWWRTLSVSHLPSFFIHLSSVPLASFLSLFHPLPLLLSSFHSTNHSFLLSPLLLFFLSSSSTYSTTRDLSQAFKTDG